MGVGGYRPERVVTNSEIVETDRLLGRVDPASAPASSRRRFAAPDESVVDMAEARRPRGHRRRPASSPARHRRRHRRHRHAPLPDPGRGAVVADRLGMPGRGVRHLRRLRRLLPRHRPGQRHGPRRQRRARPGRSASRSCRDFTDPDDRGIGVHLRRRRRGRRGRRRPTPPASARRSGAPTAPSGSHLARRDELDRRRASRSTRLAAPSRMAGPDASSAGPSGAWPRSPSRPSTRPGVTADDLDAFIPHQANMRIIDAMVKQLKLPDAHPGRPRHRRHRQHLGGLDPAGDRADAARGRGAAAAASPCRSASAPGWSTPRRSSSCPDKLPRPDGCTRASSTAPSTTKRHTKEQTRWRRASRRSSTDLAEIVNEETGLDDRLGPARQVLHRRPRHRLAVDDDDRRQRRGEVRRAHPRRRGQEPHDRRRRRQLHRQAPRAEPSSTRRCRQPSHRRRQAASAPHRIQSAYRPRTKEQNCP